MADLEYLAYTFLFTIMFQPFGLTGLVLISFDFQHFGEPPVMHTVG